jgi:uncharacterized repeat protein (TIGR02543 family)
MNSRYGRDGVRSIIGIVLMGLCLIAVMPVTARAQDSPVIDVWYGHYQRFGHIGNPQPWANIPGTVSDSSGIDSLRYSLNGGSPVALSIGPDGYRLQSPGDFNVDLAVSDLVEGLNEIVITAVDSDVPPNRTVDTVIVDYTSGNVWPLPYSVDWDTVTAIGNVAQVVDGLWELTDGAVRTAVTGYDRLIALGDVAWSDYEVTVPVTIHDRTTEFGVGILLRWNGHTDSPHLTDQPKSGYWPLGMLCWLQYDRMQMLGNLTAFIEMQGRQVSLDVTYLLKARVESVPGVGGYYSFKVWEEGQPEPSDWDITTQEDLTDPQGGSVLLIAHEADASFGDVTITPVPFSMRGVSAAVDSARTGSAITWTTSQPATSIVEYGLTPAYEIGIESEGALVINHEVVLSALLPDTVYHYRVTSVNASSDSIGSEDETFSTHARIDLSGIVSDDFSTGELNTGLWTLVDPFGDGTMTLTGSGTEDAWLNLSVPAGIEHQVHANGIEALHLLQAANDADFEVEVKFESSVDRQYQQQGIVIKQDDDNYLRFELYSTWSNTILYAQGFTDTSSQFFMSTYIGSNGLAPLYMRIRREDDRWTQSYSFDGEEWDVQPSFTHVLTVNELGPYAGNAAGADSPAYTSSIDYFFNAASPISPEDGGRYTLTLNSVGGGSVTTSPDRPTYTYGDTVVVAAAPDSGWTFVGWSDGLTGAENPDTLVMVSDTTVTATFVEGEYQLTINVFGNGSVVTIPEKPRYVFGDSVFVTAAADSGWVFGGWSEGLTGIRNPDTLVMVSDTAITAIYARERYGLVTKVNYKGTVTKSPDKPNYEYGDSVIVTAVPDSGWVFEGWSGGLTGTGNPDTIIVVSDTTITATFGAITTGVDPLMPARLTLFQNYPNPFNPTTVFGFGVPRPMDVVIRIYDVAGRCVYEAKLPQVPAGWHRFTFEGKDTRGRPLASGFYFYRIQTPVGSQTRKMVLIR